MIFIQNITGTVLRVELKRVVLLWDLWYAIFELEDFFVNAIVNRNPLLPRRVSIPEILRYSLFKANYSDKILILKFDRSAPILQKCKYWKCSPIHRQNRKGSRRMGE